LKVGGFDEDVVFYEEATLPYKIEKMGYNVRARINSCILHHEEDFSLLKWLKKKHYFGKTARFYINKYKSLYEEYVKKQVDPIYRFKIFLLNKRFWRKPYLAIGVIVLKILEYLAPGLGYATTWFKLGKEDRGTGILVDSGNIEHQAEANLSR